jgi:hypothetical protein
VKCIGPRATRALRQARTKERQTIRGGIVSGDNRSIRGGNRSASPKRGGCASYPAGCKLAHAQSLDVVVHALGALSQSLYRFSAGTLQLHAARVAGRSCCTGVCASAARATYSRATSLRSAFVLMGGQLADKALGVRAASATRRLGCVLRPARSFRLHGRCRWARGTAFGGCGLA